VPAEAAEQRPHLRVVVLDQLLPRPVAERRRPLRRSDDVGEENRREHSVEGRVFILDRLGDRRIAPAASTTSPRYASSSSPDRMTSRAPGIWSAVHRASSTWTVAQPSRMNTTVGTWIAGSALRTSVENQTRLNRTRSPGAALFRCSRGSHSTNAGSFASRSPVSKVMRTFSSPRASSPQISILVESRSSNSSSRTPHG